MADQLRLTFFGTAAGFPTKTRPNTTAIGLWRGRSLYLFDAGDGVAGQFARMEILPDALRATFISHTHADHIGGLATLLQWLQLNKRKQPLTLCLPPEAVDGLAGLLGMCYLLPEWLGFDLDLLAVAEGPGYEREGVSVEAIPTRHLDGFRKRLREVGDQRPGETFSYAVSLEGKRIVYTADLAHAAEVPERIRGADLAIVELAHYTPEELGEALAGVELPRLVVTHLIDTLEPLEAEVGNRIRAAGYEGQVIIARDGMELEI